MPSDPSSRRNRFAQARLFRPRRERGAERDADVARPVERHAAAAALIRIDVTPKQGAPWPTLYVAPREAPEAGCRAWDMRASAALPYDDARTAPRIDCRAVGHRARDGAVARRPADRPCERVRLQHAQRGARDANAVSLARARALADGAVERTAFELMRPRVATAWTSTASRTDGRTATRRSSRPRSTRPRGSTSIPRRTRSFEPADRRRRARGSRRPGWSTRSPTGATPTTCGVPTARSHPSTARRTSSTCRRTLRSRRSARPPACSA